VLNKSPVFGDCLPLVEGRLTVGVENGSNLSLTPPKNGTKILLNEFYIQGHIRGLSWFNHVSPFKLMLSLKP